MNKNSIKISVIMGVYNSDPMMLCAAIDSILNQTYRDFEFIICDDCSTEPAVVKVLDYYQSRDNRVRKIRNSKNRGLAYSLNKCLFNSYGEFIARMDDDDVAHKDRFQEQVDFLMTHDEISIVGTNIILIDDNDRSWGNVKNIEYPTKYSFLYGTPFTHPTIMARRNAYISVDGYSVEKRTRRTEDYDLFMKMYAKGFKGYNLQNCLLDYRMGDYGLKKQKFRYRIDEVFIKYKGFKTLHLFPIGYIFLLKPIISGLTPSFIKKRINVARFNG